MEDGSMSLDEDEDLKLSVSTSNFNNILSHQGFDLAQIKGDVLLRSGDDGGDGCVRVDSLVLAAASTFFSTLLIPLHSMCLEEDIIIILPDFSSEDVHRFARCIYDGGGRDDNPCVLFQYLDNLDSKKPEVDSLDGRTKLVKPNDKNLTLKSIKKLVSESSPDVTYTTIEAEIKKRLRDNYKQIVFKEERVSFVQCLKCDAVMRGPGHRNNVQLNRHLKIHVEPETLVEEVSYIDLNPEDIDKIFPKSAATEVDVVDVKITENEIKVDVNEDFRIQEISKVVLEKLVEMKSPRVKMMPCSSAKNTSRSSAWSRFFKIQVDEQPVNFVACKTCHKLYSYLNTEGTSALLRHVCCKKAAKSRKPSSKEVVQQLINSESDRIEFCPLDIQMSCHVPDLDKVYHRVKVDGQKSRFLRCVHCNTIITFSSSTTLHQDSPKLLEDHECYIRHAPCYKNINLLNVQPNNEQDLRIIYLRHPERIQLTNKVLGESSLFHFDLDGKRSSFCICVKCNKFISMVDTASDGAVGNHHSCHKKMSQRFKCFLCDLELKSKHFLEIHMRNAHHQGTARVLCSFCGKNFATDNLAKKHEYQAHNPDSKKYSCQETGCTMSFHDRHKLKQHAKVHAEGKKPYACHLCGRDFNWATSFRDHMDMHNGVKKFHCNFCGKSFNKRNTFNNHRRLHTGEKPFMCPVTECGMSFVQRTACKTHARKKHNIVITEYTRNPNVKQSAASLAQTTSLAQSNRKDSAVDKDVRVYLKSEENVGIVKLESLSQVDPRSRTLAAHKNSRVEQIQVLPPDLVMTRLQQTDQNTRHPVVVENAQDSVAVVQSVKQAGREVPAVQLAGKPASCVPVQVTRLQHDGDTNIHLVDTTQLQVARIPGGVVETGGGGGQPADSTAAPSVPVQIAQLPHGQIVHIIPLQTADLNSTSSSQDNADVALPAQGRKIVLEY